MKVSTKRVRRARNKQASGVVGAGRMDLELPGRSAGWLLATDPEVDYLLKISGFTKELSDDSTLDQDGVIVLEGGDETTL
jgi:hypothetical protein